MRLPSLSMGFAQCRGLLTSEKLSREIAEGYRKRGIPCDIIYQDIGWTEYLQDFEWRKGNYENPKKMLSDLKEMGFKVVVSQDPVIAQANKKQWEEADRLGYFVKDNTNGTICIAVSSRILPYRHASIFLGSLSVPAAGTSLVQNSVKPLPRG